MRIVSLCPSITETLVDLGAAGDLVGITRYCIHPADVVRGLRKVGGTKNPDLAAIRSLSPDLVFVNTEENRAEDVSALERELRVDVSCPRTVAEVPADLRRFGALVGRLAEAESRARELEAALGRLGAIPLAARVPFLILVWREPWMAAGPDTYASDLFVRAGGRNVLTGAPASPRDRYPVLDLGAIAALGPGLVLLPDEPYPFGEAHRAELRAAVPGARVELASGEDCFWHGVRSVRGVALASSLLGGT